jgi:glycosyltransferase involved in cell wall biosynthesis
MRVALVDHRASAGGVSRFLYALLSHLADAHPQDEFVLLSVGETIDRDNLQAMFASRPNVAVAELPQPDDLMSMREEEAATRGRSDARRTLVDVIKRSRVAYDLSMRAYRWYQQRILGGKKPWYRFSFTAAAIELLDGFDVVFFAWPFFMEPAKLRTAAVGTFHDLHYKHFPDSYNPEMLRVLESQVRYWLGEMAAVVVSTRFIASDIRHYYPGVAESVDVIYLAPYGAQAKSPAEVEAARLAYGIPEKYLIYSGGRPRHKNIIVLLKALADLRTRGFEAPLVITGIGTEVIGDPHANLPEGDAATEINRYLAASGLQVGTDVIPLGYITNHDVDALTKGASAVVSASLYEAGCGPAMDAWQWGVPVAFSNIPPFVEQLDALGTQAWVFDPNNPKDVADKLAEILGDPESAKRIAEESKQAIGSYTWDDVAAAYYDVFLKARRRVDVADNAGEG